MWRKPKTILRGPSAARSDEDNLTDGLGPRIGGSPAIVLIATVVYSAADGFKSGSTFWSVFAVGLIVGAASLIVGGLVGFLFGLPRTIERPESTALLATNTNLDQISDWLTKILVGLGLVELGKIVHGMTSLASSIAPGLGGGSDAKTFATGLLVYSIADGFLVGYLGTRIVLSPRLKAAAENLESAELRRGARIADAILATPLQPPPLPPPPPSGSAGGLGAQATPAGPPSPGQPGGDHGG